VLPKKRVALVIQYLGTNYCGWQRQTKHKSVQEEIETVLADFLGKTVPIHGAGRTDSGVHAAAQVAHFDDEFSPIPPERWAKVLNNRLPSDIAITASALVPNDWHARFSARSRRYRYTIYTDKKPNLFLNPLSWHYYHQPLSEKLMQSALEPLLGNHDLSAFRRANSERAH
jgi:tRNA pseudouridine38-40 synthase